MVVCFRRAMKEDAYQVPKTVWERGRKHPGAPNHPGIPIRGFFAWSAPIDESDRNTPLGQLECTEVPTIPAPRTIASVFAIDRSLQRQYPRATRGRPLS